MTGGMKQYFVNIDPTAKFVSEHDEAVNLGNLKLNRHHMNLPNTLELIGLKFISDLFVHPLAFQAVYWLPEEANSQEERFYRNTAALTFQFNMISQKKIEVTYHTLGDVVTSMGGYYISLQGLLLFLYAFLFKKRVYKQIRSRLKEASYADEELKELVK